MSSLRSTIRSRSNPVVLDRRDRFIFFPNSKVAQRSVVRHLLADRAIVRKDDPEAWATRFDQLDDEYLRTVFKFTIVRNPFDRVVSAFSYLREKCGAYAFDDFVTQVLGTRGVAFDPHFDEQSEGLFHEGSLVVDYVARFESIDDDWQTIAARIGAPARLPHRGGSQRPRSYTDCYGADSRRVVEQLYAADLRNFGYKFEDGPPAARRHAAAVSDWLRRLIPGRPR